MMIRSIVFNLVYLVGTIFIGILILPSLILPDRVYWPFIRLYFRWVYLIEKNILGLDYREIDRENLPKIGPYIIAMKHQSAYETLKLPLLFSRPIVILKRELLMIPLWGWYAAKAGNIGINRGDPRAALNKMLMGVKYALTRGYTPIIFPQGTRVGLYETPATKPYKRGIYEMYQASGVSVVPVAVNSGLFWPRRAFLKSGGCVIFQYLPPIQPGLDRLNFMTRLQESIETASMRLSQSTKIDRISEELPENLEKRKFSQKSFLKFLNYGVALMTVLIILYIVGWFYGQSVFKKQINILWDQAQDQHITLTEPRPRLTGFPGSYHLKWSGTILTPDAQMAVPRLDVRFLPLWSRNATIDFPFGFKMTTRRPNRSEIKTFIMNALRLDIEIPYMLPVAWTKPNIQRLYDYGVVYRLRHFKADGPVMGNFTPVFQGSGTLQYDETLQPDIQMNLLFNDADVISNVLSQMLHHPMGKSFITGAIGTMSKTDLITGEKTLPLTLKIKNEKIYVGPFKIGSIGRFYWPVQ